MKKALYILLCAMMLWVSSAHAATVLWNEATNGTLDCYPAAPTNYTFVIHPIGSATDDVNYVQGVVTAVPDPNNPTDFELTYDAFFFNVPPNRRFTGLLLTYSPDLPSYTFGGLCASATGIYYGTEDLGTWVASQVTGTNDLFANLGLSVLQPGNYSMDIIPLLLDDNWPTNGTITYTLSIITTPMPPTLQISQLANQIVLSWNTNNATSFSLQCATNLTPPVAWTTMTNVPAQAGDQMVITNTIESGNHFFRLVASL